MTVATGTWHTLALDSTGRVFSAGNAKNGELARQGQTDRFCEIDGSPGDIRAIAAGFGVSFITDS